VTKPDQESHKQFQQAELFGRQIHFFPSDKCDALGVRVSSSNCTIGLANGLSDGGATKLDNGQLAPVDKRWAGVISLQG